MKKTIEIFFPIVLILLLIKIIYYDNSFLFNLDDIIISRFFYLFIFIVGINLYISYLFHTIITKIINTDINFIDTLQIFLQGGIIIFSQCRAKLVFNSRPYCKHFYSFFFTEQWQLWHSMTIKKK